MSEGLMPLGEQMKMIRPHLAGTYALMGRTNQARSILEEAERAWKPNDGSSLWIAAARARLGQKDAAFEWLEKAAISAISQNSSLVQESARGP